MAFQVRSHWQVENGLHYKLDVGLGEDDCMVHRGHAAENLATIRKIALYLLSMAKGNERMKAKRFKAGQNLRYLKKVIGF